MIATVLRKVKLLIFVVLNDDGVSERVLDFVLAVSLDLGCFAVFVTPVALGT